MMLTISGVAFTAAPDSDRERGLLGWIALTLNGQLRLDGVTLRRTLEGRITLSFPERRDGAGVAHPIVRPLGPEARRNLEDQVFRALGLGQTGVAP